VALSGAEEREGASGMLVMEDEGCFAFLNRFRTILPQTRPMLTVSHPRFCVPWRLGGYAGARFGARLTRLWQKTAIPTAAAKLLNPRYMQIESRNARFKTEMDPSIPARK
jgi:hypothetical protein